MSEAPHKGCDALIELSAVGAGTPFAVSNSNSWALNFAKPARTFTPLGGFFPKRAVKGSQWSVSLAGYFDYFDDGQALLNPGNEVDITIWPSGKDTGRPYHFGTIYLEDANTSGSPDDLIPFSASATGASNLQYDETWLGDTPV